jgi:hypothetical protein
VSVRVRSCSSSSQRREPLPHERLEAPAVRTGDAVGPRGEGLDELVQAAWQPARHPGRERDEAAGPGHADELEAITYAIWGPFDGGGDDRDDDDRDRD